MAFGENAVGHEATEEFDKFLAWLLGVIKEQGIDVLLVSGDIFDTTTPSATAKKQYCDFPAQASEAGCRQVVITAGNHDSMAHRAMVGPSRRAARARSSAPRMSCPQRSSSGSIVTSACPCS